MNAVKLKEYVLLNSHGGGSVLPRHFIKALSMLIG